MVKHCEYCSKFGIEGHDQLTIQILCFQVFELVDLGLPYHLPRFQNHLSGDGALWRRFNRADLEYWLCRNIGNRRNARQRPLIMQGYSWQLGWGEMVQRQRAGTFPQAFLNGQEQCIASASLA